MSEVLEGPVPRQDCQMRLVGDVQVRFPTLPPAEPRLCLPGLQGSPPAAWRRLSDLRVTIRKSGRVWAAAGLYIAPTPTSACQRTRQFYLLTSSGRRSVALGPQNAALRFLLLHAA